MPNASQLFWDFAAAFGASAMLSVPVTIIDKAVVENATGQKGLLESMSITAMKAIKTPHHFIFGRDYAVVHTVYTLTYLAANWTDSVCEESKASPL
jgi:hypothetical protein